MELTYSYSNIKPFKAVTNLWYSLIIIYIFIDFLRVFFENSKYLLVFNDLFIGFIFIYIVAKRKNSFYFLKYIPIYILFSLLFFVIIIIIQLFNLNQIDTTTNFSGLRTYLFPILGLLIGYEFGLSKTLDQISVHKFLLLVLFMVVGFSVFQLFIDTSKLGDIALSLVTSREHSVHSYEDETVSLTSSFFASGKKFGRFLTLLYLLYVGVRFNLNLRNNIFIIIVFLIGLVSSGSRESIYAFVFINIFLFLKFSNLRRFFIFLFYSFLFFIFFLFFKLNSDSLIRLNFLIALEEDYGSRLIGLFPIGVINIDNDFIFSGMGLGKYGQEAILVPSISEFGERYLSIFFDNNYANIISDSGIVKIIIEIGLIGFLIYSLLLLGIIYFTIKILFKISHNNDRIVFTMCIYVLLWIFFFLKAHSIISDIFLTFNLFFAVGYVTTFKFKKFN